MTFTHANYYMVKKYLSIALLGATATTFTACHAQNSGFKKTANGLEYKIIHDEPGIQKPAIGDVIEFNIKTYVPFKGGDSLLFDSRKMNDGKPVPFQVMPPQFKGDLSEGLMMLTKGDSAVFSTPIDSMLKAGMQAAPWMKKGAGQQMMYEVMVTNVKTQSQVQSEQKAAAEKQIGIDEAALKEYFAKNNIKAMRTASGLYYKIDKQGGSIKPQTGDSVSMNYTGMLMTGMKFDSNTDPAFHHVSPFWFLLGMHQVIPGWDEGIALFSKGGKGTLYIPSTMAYGQNPPPGSNIPPNSPMIFDVEVVDVVHSKAPQGGGRPPMQMKH